MDLPGVARRLSAWLGARRLWPSRLYGRLLLSYFVVSLFALLVASGFLTYFYQSYVIRSQTEELVQDGRQIAAIVRTSLVSGASAAMLERTLDVVQPFVGADALVAGPGWVVVATTPGNTDLRGFTLQQDAIDKLRSGHIVVVRGNGLNAPTPSLSVAVPVMYGGTALGAVILHRPLVGIEAVIADGRRLVLSSFLIAALLAVIFASVLSRGVGRPLARILVAAREMEAGDLGRRVEEEGPDEVRELARAFNRAAEAIGRTLEEQRRLETLRRDFVANVSHEFRAPLTSLRGFIELLEDGTISAEDSLRYLGLMREDTERLSRLVSDLLDLSRIDAGKLAMRPEEVPAGEAVAQALRGVAARAEAAGTELRGDTRAETAVWADGERLQQILRNLLDNALAHTDRGGRVEVAVEVPAASGAGGGTARPGDAGAGAGGAGAGAALPGSVRFIVSDTGEGIPPEEIDVIWERFHRVDRSRARTRGDGGGTGLGLAIVKELVERMGGRVGVESRSGQGSRFWFDLPRAPSETPADIGRELRPASGDQEASTLPRDSRME